MGIVSVVVEETREMEVEHLLAISKDGIGWEDGMNWLRT